MSKALVVTCVAAGVGAVAGASLEQQALSVSGVQKVIGMLSDMLASAKEDKHNEEIAFSKFGTWCGGEKSSLTEEIKRNGEAISLLTTEKQKLESDVAELALAIAALSDGVAANQAEIKQDEAQRTKEHADNVAEQKDFGESLDALDRAIEMLSKESYDRPGAAAMLLQLADRDRIPSKVHSVITAFAGMMSTNGGKDDPMAYQAPEANAYEFQSGGIVDMLKRLKDQFRSQLSDSQKGEMNSQHAFDMVKMDLTDAIENAHEEAAQKMAEKDRKQEQAANNGKQITATSHIKAANEKQLADTTSECSEKGMSFEEKQNLRTEEIEAISKAIEILNSPEVTGNAEKYLELVQQGKARALALIQSGDARSASRNQNQGIRRRVREFISKEAQRLHSPGLGLLAEKILSDPFAKVKGLLDAMITRLEEEANSDAVHEGWCDTELGKDKITRTRLNEEIDGLEAAIDDDKSTIFALQGSTRELSQEVAQLQAAITEATDLRKQEKATNHATVKDAKSAQAAVEAATAVLKDFYAKALTATALVQGGQGGAMQRRSAAMAKGWGLKKTVKMGSDEWNALADPTYGAEVDSGHKAGMQTFGAATQGQQDESDYGVLPMLEVIHSDFANLEADTLAEEDASQKAFDDFMIESKRNTAVKNRKIEMNNADQATTEAKLQSDTTDLKATQDQLLAAERYHAILIPKCVDKGQTYDERTKSREAEVASLREALTLLSGEDISTSA